MQSAKKRKGGLTVEKTPSKGVLNCHWSGFHLECRKVIGFSLLRYIKGHFTVVCSVPWPMKASEAGNHLALVQTSLLLSFKCKLVRIRIT